MRRRRSALPTLLSLCLAPRAAPAFTLEPHTPSDPSGTTTSLRCWGDDTYGQSNPPTTNAEFNGVAAGTRHTVAWGTHSVLCFGDCGVLPSLHNVEGICAGDLHSCAWLSDQSVVCWGTSNTHGQQNVPNNLFAQWVACGHGHNCARTDGDLVVCWGDDTWGQASPPSNLTGVTGVAAGWTHSCAIADETVRCWGDSRAGQTLVPIFTGTPKVAATGDQTCLFIESNDGRLGRRLALPAPAASVTCFGSNDLGQSDVPSSLSTPLGVAAVKGSACAISWDVSSLRHTSTGPGDAELVCWGAHAQSLANHVPEGIVPAFWRATFPQLIMAMSESHMCVIAMDATTMATTADTTAESAAAAATTTRLPDTTTALVVTTTLPAVTTTAMLVPHSTTTSSRTTVTQTSVTTTSRTSTTVSATTVTATTATSSTRTSSATTATATSATATTATATTFTTSTFTSSATTSTFTTFTATSLTTSTVSTTATGTATVTATVTATATATATTVETTAGAAGTSGFGETTTIGLADATTADLAAESRGTGGPAGSTSSPTPESTAEPGVSTATATTTPPALPPSKVAEQASQLELDLVPLVRTTFASPEAPVVVRSPGVVQTGFRLQVRENLTDWTVPVAGTGASITVPKEVVADGGGGGGDGIIFVLSVVDTPVLDAPKELPDVDDDGSTIGALGLMTATMYTLSGVRVPVDGARKPIVLTLPTNHSPGLECGFWDEAKGLWSQKGVTTVSQPAPGAPLRCSTTHLTLFAGIWAGFLATLLCTNVELLTARALRELLEPDWAGRGICIVYWLLLATIALLFLGAAIMDRRRAQQGVFSDEKFLVPVGRRKALVEAAGGANDGEDAPMVGTSTGVTATSTGSPGSPKSGHGPPDRGASMSTLDTRASGDSMAVRVGSGLRLAVCGCFNWCRNSSVLRDAIDDVISRWFLYFSEVRDLVESLWDGLGIVEESQGEDGEEGAERRERGLAAMARALLGVVLSNSAKRQAASALGLSMDVVTFLIEDPGLNELLKEAASLPLEGDADPPWKRKMQHWLELHDEVVEIIDEKWHGHANWGAFPTAVARLLHNNNPWVAAFSNCHFYTCSQRVLFWACNLLGSVMVATLFFKASSIVRGKRSRQACSSSVLLPSEQIGRLLAITLVSLVLAHIPVSILGSLHCRSIKKFRSEGCSGWKRQIRVWKVQDRLFWAFGLPYLLFCAFFIAVFLANVASAEMPSWAVTGLTTLLEEFVFVPLGIALLVPFVTMTVLGAVCWLTKTSKRAMLRERRSHRNERPGATWFQVINSI